MEGIGPRIATLIREIGSTKTAFAESLGISQAFVSQICSGSRAPSERTILDICKKYHVSEQWLRTGDGEMIPPMTREQEIASYTDALLSDSPDSLRSIVISYLMKWDVEDWEAVAKILKKHGLPQIKDAEEPAP